MFVYSGVYILAVVLEALVLMTEVTDVSKFRTFGEIGFCAFTFSTLPFTYYFHSQYLTTIHSSNHQGN